METFVNQRYFTSAPNPSHILLGAVLKYRKEGDGMSALYYKDESICEAIKEAIVSFGKKNSINGMEYFASELGYNGPNKSIQLHNRLHVGNTEKFLKKAELEAILKQMEKPEQKIQYCGNNFSEIVKTILQSLKQNDLLLILGAGDITKIGKLFREELSLNTITIG